jgi:5-aminopentanamidase
VSRRQPQRATLRVAAAQAESSPGDITANVTTAVSLVRTAAERGARVVVLPELFLTGYAPRVWTPEQALGREDARLDPLRDAAVAAGVVVVAGAAVRRGAGSAVTLGLSVVVIDEAGAVSAPYDKQHLIGLERGVFVPGDHGASVLVDGWELGLGVCYDGCFPEHAAAAARDGAQVYLCPAAYFAGSEHRRDLYSAARALDNGIYVVFAGLTGRCGDLDFCGGSAVYDPEGRALDRVGPESPAVVVAELHAAEVERVQTTHPIAADRLSSLGSRLRLTAGSASRQQEPTA